MTPIIYRHSLTFKGMHVIGHDVQLYLWVFFAGVASFFNRPLDSISFIGMSVLKQVTWPNCLAACPQPQNITSCYRLYLLDGATERSDGLRYPASVAGLLVVMGRLFLIALICDYI